MKYQYDLTQPRALYCGHHGVVFFIWCDGEWKCEPCIVAKALQSLDRSEEIALLRAEVARQKTLIDMLTIGRSD